MKAVIFGSRTLTDNVVKCAIYDAIQKHHVTHILTAGEPAGVCALARQVAKELALPLTLYFLDFRYARGAFDHRSRVIYAEGDIIFIFGDGESRGTLNELKIAQHSDKPYYYEILPKSPVINKAHLSGTVK